MSDFYIQPDDEMILTIRIEDEDYEELRAYLAEDHRIREIRESGMAFDSAFGNEAAKIMQVLSDHRLHVKMAAEAMEVGKDAIHQLIAAAISIFVVRQNLKNQKAIEAGEKEPILLDADGHRIKLTTKPKAKKH